jgi:hypothetical protein
LATGQPNYAEMSMNDNVDKYVLWIHYALCYQSQQRYVFSALTLYILCKTAVTSDTVCCKDSNKKVQNLLNFSKYIVFPKWSKLIFLVFIYLFVLYLTILSQ